MYYLYLLQSQVGEHFYTGVTKDLSARLKRHNVGSTRSTKPYRPWMIVYTESFANKLDAYKREYYLKSPAGYLEKKQIIQDNRKVISGGVA